MEGKHPQVKAPPPSAPSPKPPPKGIASDGNCTEYYQETAEQLENPRVFDCPYDKMPYQRNGWALGKSPRDHPNPKAWPNYTKLKKQPKGKYKGGRRLYANYHTISAMEKLMHNWRMQTPEDIAKQKKKSKNRRVSRR